MRILYTCIFWLARWVAIEASAGDFNHLVREFELQPVGKPIAEPVSVSKEEVRSDN